MPSAFELESLGITAEKARGANICKAMGCEHCGQKGYVGRTIIAELLPVTDDIRSLVMQRKDGNTIKKLAVSKGFKTFRDHGIEKVLAGITTMEELLTNTQIDI